MVDKLRFLGRKLDIGSFQDSKSLAWARRTFLPVQLLRRDAHMVLWIIEPKGIQALSGYVTKPV
jgi:hypothetical protein